MSDEKDREIARSIAYHFLDESAGRQHAAKRIAEAFAAIRQEERAAAWTQALNMTRVTASATGMPELWALYEAMKREAAVNENREGSNHE